MAKDNGIELSYEEAKKHFSSLHRNGEIKDDELNSVSGGGCHIDRNGKTYTVVTSACKCFTGMYEKAKHRTPHDDWGYGAWFSCSKDGCCGYCKHLWITGGIGFCYMTAK